MFNYLLKGQNALVAGMDFDYQRSNDLIFQDLILISLLSEKLLQSDILYELDKCKE